MDTGQIDGDAALAIAAGQSYRRSKFRTLTKNTVDALNRISWPRVPLTYRFGEQIIHLSPIPLGPAFYNPYRFNFGAGISFGPVDIDRYLVKKLVGLLDVELAEAALSDEVLEIALAQVLSEPFTSFETRVGLKLEPKLIAIEAAGHQGKTAFDFAVTFDGDDKDAAPARARVWMHHSDLPEFAECFDRIFKPRASTLPISLPMHLVAGSCRLSLTELHHVGVGDVLLIEDIAGPWPSAWLIVGNRRRIPLSMMQRQARLAGTLENTMSEQSDANIEEGHVDDLEVDIKFELGRAYMPLRQLKMLAEGGVIPLERDYSSPVDVVVGGRRVGEGEIVDIDGKIGVRLVRFQGK